MSNAKARTRAPGHEPETTNGTEPRRSPGRGTSRPRNGNGAAAQAAAAATASSRPIALAPATADGVRVLDERPRSQGPSTRDAVFRRLLALADLAAAAGGLALMAATTGHPFRVASLVTLPLIVLIAKLAGRYDHDEVVLRKSTLDETPGLLTVAAAYALSWSIATVPLGLTGSDSTRTGVIVLWISTAVLMIVLRSGARQLAQVSAPVERALVIGNSLGRARLARRLACDPCGVEVVGFLPLEDERRAASDWGPRSRRRSELSIGDLRRLVEERDVDRVFVVPTSTDSEAMLDAVSQATAVGAKVSIVPRILEVVGSAVEFDTVGGVTVLSARRPGLGRSSLAIKRTMDVVGSFLGLIILAPFAAVLAVAIKLDSRGPVFFRQLRVGRSGETFQMIKFRSMVDGAHAQRQALMGLNETDGLFKLTRDPRVTRVGRFLRSSSLDELPQLINVLKGEMSLVGPRPLVVEEDSRVEGRHRSRLQLPPGMTGPWQILGATRVPLSEMVKIDYLYAANWSLWTDVKILLRTLGHVAARRGV